MRKIACILLALALLAAFPAGAEEAEWEAYECEFGVSFFYDASEFGVDVSTKDGAVLVYPLALAEKEGEKNAYGFDLAWKDPQNQACIRISAPYNGGSAWAKPEGWTPPEEFEPLEGDAGWALPGWISRHVINDDIIGPCACDEMVFEGTDELYFLYEAYMEGDPDGWGEALWAVVETLEFPAQPAKAGSFRLDFFYGGAAGMQFIPVEVNEEAEPIVLRAQAAVSDFVLEKLIWNDEDITVSGTETLYAADSFAPGDNLEIFCYFSDVRPDLRIRCVNAQGKAECWYLFQSGRDGSLLLLSEVDIWE